MKDQIKKVNFILLQTEIEKNILLANLIELELAGKVDFNIKKILRLLVKFSLYTNLKF